MGWEEEAAPIRRAWTAVENDLEGPLTDWVCIFFEPGEKTVTGIDLHFFTTPWMNHEHKIRSKMLYDYVLCREMGGSQMPIPAASVFAVTNTREDVTCQACLEWLHA